MTRFFQLRLPIVVKKEVTAGEQLRRYVPADSLLLNLGSGNIRFAPNSIGIDIQKKDEVDVIADAHSLPFRSEIFDACICVGAFQYFHDPAIVVQEVRRVLKSGGWVIVDAPFVQHYCSDKPDLYRFTKAGLEGLFARDFEIVDCQVSISGGSALAFYVRGLSGFVSSNRIIDAAMRLLVGLAVVPLRYLKFGLAHEVAGAHVLVARKRPDR